MTQVQCFEVNPFAENSYVVYDDSGECIVVDPGFYLPGEMRQLTEFIALHKLKVVRLLNTHCHLDHVFGNRFVAETYNVGLEIHRGELPVLERYIPTCQLYGIPAAEPSPAPAAFLEPGQFVEFGRTRLEILYTPGHSPASVSFYNADDGWVLAGDVLFHESIGRTDLPGGDFETLLESIRSRLFTLPDETLVYPGHGPTTTVRHEKEYNPFL